MASHEGAREHKLPSNNAMSKLECPVCLNELTDASGILPFRCGHPICTTCDAQMTQRDDNRCPVCRVPREGMSVHEAEPSPRFNAPSLGSLFIENMIHSMPRPQTGHTLFFPTESPIQMPGTIPNEYVAALEQQNGEPTVADIHRDLVDALRNVPSMTISQWRRRAAQQRRAEFLLAQQQRDSAD